MPSLKNKRMHLCVNSVPVALFTLCLLLFLAGCQSGHQNASPIADTPAPADAGLSGTQTAAAFAAGGLPQTPSPAASPLVSTLTPLATHMPLEAGIQIFDENKKVLSAAWAPDSSQLFAAVKDSGLVVMSGADKSVTAVVGTTTDITALAAHPNGLYLAIGVGTDGTVQLVSNQTGLPERAFLGAHTGRPYKLAFDRYGRQLVSCGEDGRLFLWDVESGQMLQTLYEGSNCTDLVFSPSGLLLVAGFGEEQVVRLWNTETWQMFFSFTVDGVEDIGIDPNGMRIVTAGGDKSRSAQVWNLYTGTRLLTLPDPQAPIWSAAYSPDGKLIATAGSGQYVYLWDAITGEPVYELEAGQEFLRWLSFSPDGSLLAAAGNVIRLWDAGELGLSR